MSSRVCSSHSRFPRVFAEHLVVRVCVFVFLPFHFVFFVFCLFFFSISIEGVNIVPRFCVSFLSILFF